MCDTALGNSPVEAEAGTLNAFVGADQKTLEKLRPVMETWATTIVHVGDVGDGHKVKLVNNFIGMAYVAVYAEAFTACEAIGLDPKKLYDVVKPGGLYCGMFERITRWVTMRDPKAHLMRINNSLKDITYFNRMVEQSGMTSLMGHAAQQLFILQRQMAVVTAPCRNSSTRSPRSMEERHQMLDMIELLAKLWSAMLAVAGSAQGHSYET